MLIKHFTQNLTGKDWVVGDIHGCFTALRTKLDEIGFNKSQDRLFCVGDLVDRGPESIDVLDILAEPWFHSVLGNHDQLAIDCYAATLNTLGFDECLYKQNGGQWFILLDIDTQRIIANAFHKLPIVIEVDTKDGLVGIVHADCPFDDWNIFKEALDDADRQLILKCLWNRDRIRNPDKRIIKNIHKVYHGHTVLKTDVLLGNRHYIDTGLVFKNYLTIKEL